jgi:hypothetical protein
MNPYLMEVMLKEKKREMLIEAERLRLLAAYEANRQSRKSRLLSALGELLITVGEKLTRRYSHEQNLPTG